MSRHAKSRRKRPQRLLLDDTQHHQAMRWGAERDVFTDLARRGRPDILHTSLLVAMEHRLNKEGRLRVWVHTRNDERIRIAPETRLQRSQHRFYGLLESLYQNGRLPPETSEPELLALEDGFPLQDVVRATKAHHVFVFDEGGEDLGAPGALEEAFGAVKHGEDLCFVVGAFPSGGFGSRLGGDEPAPRHVALGDAALTAWAVVGEAMTRCLTGPLGSRWSQGTGA